MFKCFTYEPFVCNITDHIADYSRYPACPCNSDIMVKVIYEFKTKEELEIFNNSLEQKCLCCKKELSS